jgi:uncharacterized protein YidB (DUF937 family)
MGLFDGLAGQLGGLLSQDGEGQSAGVVSALLGAGSTGGIGATLETLASNGLAEHVSAWTSGQALPISPDQLRDALGSQQVQQMAGAAGLPVEDFLQHLANHLPAAAAATAGA